jgi:hypothetical protein
MTTRNGFSFDDFLEDNPDILYGGLRPQAQMSGLGSNFLDYWRRRGGNVRQDYLGGIGRTALLGQDPTQTFQSFLRDYDFSGRYRGLSPSQRGESRNILTPRIRYNL